MTSVEKNTRKFISNDFKVTAWDDVKPYFETLKLYEINSASDLKTWMLKRSELETALQEDLAWRYIRMTCDTENKELEEAFNFFVGEIEPNIAPYAQELNLKFLNSPFLNELHDERFNNLIRQTKRMVEIYRDENIPLLAELHQKEQTYGSISGAMTITVDGNEITLQQASNYLKDSNRTKREEVYLKIWERRLADKNKLDDLFTELIALRHKIAVNAGFENFRDYSFASMGRFDYTPDDCFRFHESIAKHVVPLNNAFDAQRKSDLKLETLKPWDTEVDTDGKSPLKPFANGNEMMEKTIKCFTEVHPFFGECMQHLKQLNRVDLDSRKGKAPGGYNYPLYETGVPFIFMNSTGLLRDLVTIVHEGGHAVHSILDHPLEIADFKSTPSEVAELASMGMELISMEHWHHFFNANDLKRAKLQHLEDVVSVLPWIATVDKFQHWVYEHPGHSVDERENYWNTLQNEFGGNVVNWKGQELIRKNIWQKQLHIFEVPFYYIEYGMAQLGAIALWRNYKQNRTVAVEQYIAALKLGYTKTIGEIYNAAGIRFDFSEAAISELMAFVKNEMELIKNSAEQ